MTVSRRAVVLGLPACWAVPARAQAPLSVPSGPVVLSVTGRVRLRNRGDAADFDMAMLERLTQLSVNTRTPWYAESRKFSGPLLRDVLAAAGADGQTLRAIALNDYRVDIPMDDVRRHDVIVARLLDDKPMSVREKGPLFVMYPFDTQPALRNAVYFSRCVWQLQALEVL